MNCVHKQLIFTYSIRHPTSKRRTSAWLLLLLLLPIDKTKLFSKIIFILILFFVRESYLHTCIVMNKLSGSEKDWLVYRGFSRETSKWWMLSTMWKTSYTELIPYSNTIYTQMCIVTSKSNLFLLLVDCCHAKRFNFQRMNKKGLSHEF